MTSYTTVLNLTKPDFNAVGWDTAMNANLDTIDAAISQSIFFVASRGAWLNSTLYAVNDLAIDSVSSEIYKCLVAHTSAITPTLFSADRAANPTYWLLQSTAAASAAAAAAYSTAASGSAVSAAASAVTATTQAGDALTHATNSNAFAVAAGVSAAAAANAAIAAAAVVTNTRAILSLVPAAVADTDLPVVVPAGYIAYIMQYTTTAYTGATVTAQVGTTVGGVDIVAAVDIKAVGVRTLTIVGAIAPTIAPYGGGTIHVRIVQTTPTAVGAGKLVIVLVPA